MELGHTQLDVGPVDSSSRIGQTGHRTDSRPDCQALHKSVTTTDDPTCTGNREEHGSIRDCGSLQPVEEVRKKHLESVAEFQKKYGTSVNANDVLVVLHALS
jgi:hypothetical protein